ncbi:MAG: SNF2-related protein [Bacillota bacterium]|nr:SNF2-related protein [Bacillota bacterium]
MANPETAAAGQTPLIAISESQIRALAPDQKIWDGGRMLQQGEMVRTFASDRAKHYVHANVSPGPREQYHVIVKLDKRRMPVSVACNCATFAETDRVCAHVIAVLLHGAHELYQGDQEDADTPSPWTKADTETDDGFLTYQPQIAAEAKDRGKARPSSADDHEHEERYDPFNRFEPPPEPEPEPEPEPQPEPDPEPVPESWFSPDLLPDTELLPPSPVRQTARHTHRVNRELLGRLRMRPAPTAASTVAIKLTLHLFPYGHAASMELRFGYREGGRPYVVRKPITLLESFKSGQPLELGKYFTWLPDQQPLDPFDHALLSWLDAEQEKSESDSSSIPWYNPPPLLQRREVYMDAEQLVSLLELMTMPDGAQDRSILLEEEEIDPIVCRGWPPPRLALRADPNGSRLHLTTTGAPDDPPVPCYTTRIDYTKRIPGESGIQVWSPDRTGGHPEPAEDALFLLTDDARLLLYQKRLYLTPNDKAGRALYGIMATPQYAYLNRCYRELHLDDQETAELLERLGERTVAGRDPLHQIDPAMAAQIDATPTPPSLWLDSDGGAIVAALRQPLTESQRRWVMPDRSGAAALSTVLTDSGFRQLDSRHRLVRQAQPGDEIWLLTDDAAIYQFLTDFLPPLIDQYPIYLSEALKRMLTGTPRSFRMRSSLNRDNQLIDIDLGDCPYSREELEAILNATREKRRFVRLHDGRFLTLVPDRDPHTADDDKHDAATAPVDQASVLAVLDTLLSWGARSATRADGSLKLELPVGRALAVAALAGDDSDDSDDADSTGPLTRDAELARLDRIFHRPADSHIPLPAGLHAELRPYQKVGFQWLALLAQHSLGGILADDMGLGKTLQALALILHVRQSRREAGRPPLPSLVVAPTSLIFNWYDEARRFTPDLGVMVVEGSRSQREERLAIAGPADLIVLSYTVLRRDIDLLRQKTFACCFLDEAQAIKNAATRTARAVKSIRADHRFALTGTPIENALSELWSVFDFLMPGYLGNATRFQRLYVDEGRTDALRGLVAPFILRRMKSDVLRELPDKIETVIHCDMTVEQRALYLAWHQRAVDQMTTFAKEKQPTARARARFGVLAILTRLRQVCCHPALFVENYRGGAGKFAALDELLDRLLASRHRILLFSQFTTMLALIRERLEAQGRPYFYIDGTVPAAERLDLVRRFNAGENDLFLISLRAGGTGLNLIGADTVIHYDPWWNPAAEEQASDRAHRIGQKRVVQVFRLVMRGSVEERIQALQEAKRELVREVIRPGDNPLTRLSTAELSSLIGSADDPGVAWPAEVADNDDDREDDAP